ncbi:MAG: cell division protein [Rhodospirillales bacterium]|nr:cell division protein [Rhodospirillales bacterium]
MLAGRTDLPFANDATGRFLPLVVTLMVFLAALALAAMMAFHGLVGRWNRDVAATLTIQVPVATGPESAARTKGRVEAVLKLLTETEGVARAEALALDRVAALLEPWLGSGDLVGELPLPRLIDVALEPGRVLDTKALAARLQAVAPGTQLEDHRVWLSRVLRLARAVEALTAAVLALIGLVTSATVIYATRTGLAVHAPAIELLHLIGARDAYIAGQFAGRAFGLGFKGGLIGLGLAVPTLYGLDVMAQGIGGGLLPDLRLSIPNWLAIALLPLVAALLATVTARLTVHRALARMT